MSSTEKVISKSQGGIQSLEIGLAVLDVLVEYNEPMMLKDIAHALEMHPAKAHRYLVSLIRKNYARKLDDGRYGLGARVKTLGYTSLDQNNLLQRLSTAATEIKDTLKCGVQISKWFNEGPIIIQSFEPDSPISIITRIGSRMPLSSSATGKLFASYHPNATIKPLMLAEWQSCLKETTKKPATGFTDAELTAKWQAFTELQTAVRRQGYATVTGDMLMGINAVSIPILPPQATTAPATISAADDRQLEYALTVIGTTEQLPLRTQQQTIRQIMTIVQHYQVG